ncbi:hypothetical protein [Pleurochrysis sp. endemic virus 2]|nr:hypothetical protein [Pleurochrysis sp. endemic virus 2]
MELVNLQRALVIGKNLISFDARSKISSELPPPPPQNRVPQEIENLLICSLLPEQ